MFLVLSIMLILLTGADIRVESFVLNSNKAPDLSGYSLIAQDSSAQVQPLKAFDRGRVTIDNISKTLLTDNGLRLRGEHLRIANLPWLETGKPYNTHLDRAYDTDVWLDMIETFHLNTVRLLLYRPPQNWGGGPGLNCPVERCFASVQDAIPHIDAMVEIASNLGMYAIIDYHPVGGYVEDDAIAWWNALAPRYKDRTHVIYELSNEPVRWSAAAYQAADIQFEEDLYQLIRSHAPDTHIILWSFAETSGNGTSMLTKVNVANSISYNNASVGYHPYGSYNQSEIKALRNASYPVMNTEIGGGPRDEYLTRTENAENLGVSWIWLDGTGFNKDWTEPLPVTWPKDPKTGAKARVETPTIFPNGGTFVISATMPGVTITLKTDTPDAAIRYTLNKNEPGPSSTLYTEPFTLSTVGTTTVKAKAFKDNLIDSITASSDFGLTKAGNINNYTIRLPIILKP